MTGYILRRIPQMLLVFIGVTIVIYASVFLLPGNPVAALGGGQPLPATVVHNLELKYHLNDPLWQQYGLYMVGLLRGDFGYSIEGQSVLTLMEQRWPITATLALTAWGFEGIFGIGAGIIAGLRRGSAVDRGMLVFTTLGVSVPIFVTAFVAQVLLGIHFHLVPVEGVQGGWPLSYVVPGFALAIFGIAAVGRLTRAALLETLRTDYVRFAVAKGLPPTWVVGKHAMRNAALPIITYLGIDLGFLLGGAVVIEGIFNLPGIGQLLFNSIQTKDSSVVVGIGTALVLIFLLGNLCVDIAYAVLDPRIRYG